MRASKGVAVGGHEFGRSLRDDLAQLVVVAVAVAGVRIRRDWSPGGKRGPELLTDWNRVPLGEHEEVGGEVLETTDLDRAAVDVPRDPREERGEVVDLFAFHRRSEARVLVALSG